MIDDKSPTNIENSQIPGRMGNSVKFEGHGNSIIVLRNVHAYLLLRDTRDLQSSYIDNCIF